MGNIPIIGPLLDPPKPQRPVVKVTPAPAEKDNTTSPVDPNALANARDRALEAAKRANRKKFQIPLSPSANKSGLNIV